MPVLRTPAQARSAAQWLTDKYILLMLGLFPLFTGLEGYADITRSKFLFFAIATGVWLLALGAVRLRAGGLRRPRPGVTDWLCIGYAALACLSALCSPHRVETLLGGGRYDGLLTTLLYCAIVLGVSHHAAPRQRYAVALALSMTVCCAIALLQLTGRNPFSLFPANFTYQDANIRYSGAFLGTIGNIDVLAAYLCCGIGVCFGMAVCSARQTALLYLIPGALGMLALTASGVAAGAVGMAGGLLVSAPVLISTPVRARRAGLSLAALLVGAAGAALFDALSLLRALLLCAGAAAALAAGALLSLQGKKGQTRLLVLVLVCALLLAGFVLVWNWPGADGSIYELSQLLRGNADDSFGSSRIGIWRRSLELIAERPLLGGGPGTAALRLDMTFSRRIPETGMLRTVRVDNAHNVFLGCAVDLGLPALALLLAFLAATFIRWVRAYKHALAPAFGPGVCACAVQAVFGLGLCLTAPVFLILLALTASAKQKFTGG